MEVSQRALAQMLLYCLICGLALGLFFDVLRLVRTLAVQGCPDKLKRLAERLSVPQRLSLFPTNGKHQNSGVSALLQYLLLMLQDIFFCLVAAVTLILVFYATNDGQFRFGGVTVMLMGFLLYLVTLARLLRLVSDVIAIIVRAVFAWSICILLFPIVKSCRWIARRTRPLCMRVKENVRLYLSAMQQRREKIKHTRSVQAENSQKNAATMRPPNGRHHFASGKKQSMPPS